MGKNWAIVCIPEEDDYIWKISSEKIPHFTLLSLGDQVDPSLETPIAEYLQHVAETSLPRFGMQVDHRGELGPDQADVLFFETPSWNQAAASAREYLLKNNIIMDAYNSSPQFDQWTPHITLGFPVTPAHPDNRDYPGIHWVNFDKIALWTNDFSGPTFDLKRREDTLAMSTVRDKVLDFLMAGEEAKKLDAVHFGTRGMKWGIRHLRGSGGRVTSKVGSVDDSKFAADTKARVAKAGGTHVLTNDELKRLNERINLENSYSQAVLNRKTSVDTINTKARKALDLGRNVNDAIKFGASPAGQLMLRAVGAHSVADSATKATHLGKAGKVGKKKH